MNSITRMRKMTRARIAFSVMLRPHEELTERRRDLADVDAGRCRPGRAAPA